MRVLEKMFKDSLEVFFAEDDLQRNLTYMTKLPSEIVKCQLKVKDDLLLVGLPIFFETFNYLLENPIDYSPFVELEGKFFSKSDNRFIEFELPFNVALSGERIALNLIQKMSSIATYTKKFVNIANEFNIKILDTRKTTPGYRALEKYAVEKAGGYNHRFGQNDVWMIKDNHKTFFGGIKNAIDYFKSMHGFYTPIVLEVHSVEELKEAIELNVHHVMLDNFSPEEIKSLVDIKPAGMTFEVSGGINLNTLKSYCVEGVDAISVGSITYNAPAVDLSLKYHRKLCQF